MKHPQKKISLAIFAVLLGATTFSPAGYAVPGIGTPPPVAPAAPAPTAPTAPAPTAPSTAITTPSGVDLSNSDGYIDAVINKFKGVKGYEKITTALPYYLSKVRAAVGGYGVSKGGHCTEENGRKLASAARGVEKYVVCLTRSGNKDMTGKYLGVAQNQVTDRNCTIGMLIDSGNLKGKFYQRGKTAKKSSALTSLASACLNRSSLWQKIAADPQADPAQLLPASVS